MRTVRLSGGAISVRDDVEPPAPAPGEALVRVRTAGICGTDLELLRGYRGFEGTPGHEFVGTVEDGPAEWSGSRVVADINVTCRSRGASASDRADSGAAGEAVSKDAAREEIGSICRACRRGLDPHCERRAVLGIDGRDGAFAEHVSVPVRNLHRVPASLPDEAAVFAEPLAAALRVLEQVGTAPGDRALVVGPGRLGLLVARALGLELPAVQVAGRSPASIERARAAGLDAVRIEKVAPAACDLVVDCTGGPGGFEAALRAVRPRGTLVLKSTWAGRLSLEPAALVVDELRVIGSRCGSIANALAVLGSGRIDPTDLVDDRFPLAEAEAAFARASSPGVAKVLLDP